MVQMKIITIAWAFALLFMGLALATSVITVEPGRGQWVHGVSALAALLCMTSAFSAILLGLLHRRRPEAAVFRSKGLLAALIVGVLLLALLLTMMTGA